MLRNDDFRSSLVEFLDDPIGIKGLVAEQSIEVDAVDQRCDTDGVAAVPRQQFEADKIAQGIGQYKTFHPKCESHLRQNRNPKSPQPLGGRYIFMRTPAVK